MTRNVRSPIAVILLAALVTGGCFNDAPDPNDPAEFSGPAEIAEAQAQLEPEGEAAIFGTEDTVCQSIRLGNEDDDLSKIAEMVECLMIEVDAGRAVTVDAAAITVEGDPIYMRYSYDGDTVLMVEDHRADTYDNGSVVARRCGALRETAYFPEGADCQVVEHAGFPEAVG